MGVCKRHINVISNVQICVSYHDEEVSNFRGWTPVKMTEPRCPLTPILGSDASLVHTAALLGVRFRYLNTSSLFLETLISTG